MHTVVALTARAHGGRPAISAVGVPWTVPPPSPTVMLAFSSMSVAVNDAVNVGGPTGTAVDPAVDAAERALPFAPVTRGV